MLATRRIRRTKSLVEKSLELALAVPQVVAHRTIRAALAGPDPSDRDRAEFRMMAEKQAAFIESWGGMALQMVRANQALTASILRSFVTPFSQGEPSGAQMAGRLQKATIDVLHKGLAPVHRKAVSNARRLAKTKLR